MLMARPNTLRHECFSPFSLFSLYHPAKLRAEGGFLQRSKTIRVAVRTKVDLAQSREPDVRAPLDKNPLQHVAFRLTAGLIRARSLARARGLTPHRTPDLAMVAVADPPTHTVTWHAIPDARRRGRFSVGRSVASLRETRQLLLGVGPLAGGGQRRLHARERYACAGARGSSPVRCSTASCPSSGSRRRRARAGGQSCWR